MGVGSSEILERDGTNDVRIPRQLTSRRRQQPVPLLLSPGYGPVVSFIRWCWPEQPTCQHGSPAYHTKSSSAGDGVFARVPDGRLHPAGKNLNNYRLHLVQTSAKNVWF